MLSSLLRPPREWRRSSRSERAALLSPRDPDNQTYGTRYTSQNGVRRSKSDSEQDEGRIDDDDEELDADGNQEDNEDGDFDEDGPDDAQPLLPIFSAAHLDALPVYELTHAIRLLITARCETVLSWEQLRSPQVSQFLVKPIQQEIQTKHFSAATMYALMANCLQFVKEANLYPGNSGTSKTRAMLSQLLAIKLVKEYTTRELIDALSYDFDPLQGQSNTTPTTPTNARGPQRRKPSSRSARISCLEVAIRAQAKHFLAHPLVVQHLEAIWDGAIVFHSAADSMHRRNPTHSHDAREHGKEFDHDVVPVTARRAVTLYDPRDASLFKLSRLRVPKYRNILSTGSFAILLGLFLAVLIERSLEITTLEIIFWFWSAGYMLDEIVGFNEQGFGLYIASFWNTFDLGILFMLFVHLCLRIYGIVMPDVRKHTVANLAYDVLAADAILLFPRLFSVLDHYRYFSQLLIAFRMMAQDLIAVFVLILISCSGFLVALTLSFGNEGIDTPANVAYALLQILMGFTPAAWDRWAGYNVLGKTILILFLFICHFLVVTILITVLTNSFMAIVQNANEEHQFVFAVNTISAVKSDDLFSYVAPANIFQWLLSPLNYVLPFRQFLKVNRTMIKVTHFPILFTIYFYEKTILRSSVVDSIDIVENRGRASKHVSSRLHRLAREPSIATFRQDLALEEVFRKPFDSTMRNTQQSQERHKSSNVVSNWMQNMDDDQAGPPQEQDRKVVDRLERRLQSRSLRGGNRRDFTRGTMSVASDPEEFTSHADLLSPGPRILSNDVVTPLAVEVGAQEAYQQTDADGDDELPTDDHDEDERVHRRSPTMPEPPMVSQPKRAAQVDYFSKRSTPRTRTPELSGSLVTTNRARFAENSIQHGSVRRSPKQRPHQHNRNVSAATMIFDPPADSSTEQTSSRGANAFLADRIGVLGAESGALTPTSKPNSNATSRKALKKAGLVGTRLRPVLPNKDNPAFRSAPIIARVGNTRQNSPERQRPSLVMDIVSDIGDNKAIGGGYIGAIPASFATQMAYATGGLKQTQSNDSQEMLGRLMMTRMNSLEEGLREVIHEMRETNKKREPARNRSPERPVRGTVHRERKAKDKDRPGTAGGTASTKGRESPVKGPQYVESPLAGEQGDEPSEQPPTEPREQDNKENTAPPKE